MAHTDRLLRLLNSVSYRGATAIAAAPGTAKDDPFHVRRTCFCCDARHTQWLDAVSRFAAAAQIARTSASRL